MAAASQRLDAAYAAIRRAAERGVAHLTLDDAPLDGRSIRVGGRELLNFGSCSYLGLELDPRVKRGAIDAIERYGVHLSSSRSYLSAPDCAELEALLARVFGARTLVTTSTTLAHLSALPVLVGEGDAVLYDAQVHHSVQTAVFQLAAQGIRVGRLPHNRLDRLEERARSLARRHRRVWYLADGVYSMYADLAPLDGLRSLLERCEPLHLYLDDAHGMSWCGRHGRGYVLEGLPHHPRLVVATSLGKGFGVGGGALVFPDDESWHRVRSAGGPMIFGGPLAPPLLGAAVASARIHLSDEIGALQGRLRQRIRAANALLASRGVPLATPSEVPIRYVPLGSARAAERGIEQLMEAGFHTNLAMFPAVRRRDAGIRFTLTLHQRSGDVEALVDTLAALARDRKAGARRRRARPARGARHPGGLELQHETSIAAFEPAEWDAALGCNGAFTHGGLSFLEAAFGGRPDPENDWGFHYYAVRDRDGRPVALSWFTAALWKDDMLAPPEESRRAEALRRSDRYALTSRIFSMGSLLTEGSHLFLPRRGDWRQALGLLLDAVDREAAAWGARATVLRDLPDADPELDALLRDAGFEKLPMPESWRLELDFADGAERLRQLPRGRRWQLKSKVLRWDGYYDVDVLRAGGRRPAREELEHYYRLYRNVKERGLELNVFPLPDDLFERMLEFPGWELLTLRLRPERGGEAGALPQGVVACFAGPEQYVPTVIGLDYDYVRSHGLYRQCLWQSVLRAREHGARRVHFGMGAPVEKRRLGARPEQSCLYARALPDSAGAGGR